MTWIWTFTPEPEDDVPAQEAFTAQGDAESWLGLHWRTLAEAGVESVALLHSGDRVYVMDLSAD